MTRRVGIADAPRVNLGTGGREQVLPVLEVFPTSERRPGSTTIADMAAFFLAGGGVVIPQIQRLYLNTSEAIVLSENGNQAPGTFSESVSIPVQKEVDSLIAGNLDFYTIAQGRIAFSVPGAYRLTGKLYTERTANGRVSSTQTTIPGQQITAQATVLAQNVNSTGRQAAVTAAGQATIPAQSINVRGGIEAETIQSEGEVEEGTAIVLGPEQRLDIDSTGQLAASNPQVRVNVPAQDVAVAGQTPAQNITANGATAEAIANGTVAVPRASFMAVVLLGNIGRTQIIYGESQEVLSGSNTQSHLFAEFTAVFRALVNDEVEIGAQVYNNGIINTQGAPAQWTFLDALSAGRAEVLIERIAE